MKALNQLAIAAMLAGASLANHASASNASASASIDWSTFTVSIYDIEPQDGQTPTITFDDHTKLSAVGTATNNASLIVPGPNGGIQSPDAISSSSWSPAPALSVANALASGNVAAGNSDTSISSSASMTAPLAGVWKISSAALKSANFTINGAGVVVFTADYSVATQDDNLTDNLFPQAHVTFYAGLLGDGGYPYGTSETSFGGGGNDSWTDTVAIAVVNPYNLSPTRGFFRASTFAAVDTNLAPVPEPSEYLMMLAGLGLVGFAVRRRQQ